MVVVQSSQSQEEKRAKVVHVTSSEDVLASVVFTTFDRYRYPKPIHIYRVSLKVGEREFFGEGETMQTARHCAATMALNVLRTLPLPTREHPVDSETMEDDDETASGKGSCCVL